MAIRRRVVSVEQEEHCFVGKRKVVLWELEDSFLGSRGIVRREAGESSCGEEENRPVGITRISPFGNLEENCPQKRESSCRKE